MKKIFMLLVAAFALSLLHNSPAEAARKKHRHGTKHNHSTKSKMGSSKKKKTHAPQANSAPTPKAPPNPFQEPAGQPLPAPSNQ